LTYLKFRWLMAAYLLFPLYFLSRLDAEAAEGPPARRLATVVLVAEVLIVVAFAVNIVRGDRLGNASHLNVPYDRIAAPIAAAGFSGGTIAGGEGALAGNLALAFRGSRVIRLANPDYLPRRRGDGQCLVAWDKERGDTVPGELRDWLAAALGLTLRDNSPVRVAEAPFHFARRQTLRVHYVLLPNGSGECH